MWVRLGIVALGLGLGLADYLLGWKLFDEPKWVAEGIGQVVFAVIISAALRR